MGACQLNCRSDEPCIGRLVSFNRRYRLLGKIGSGAFSQVHLASQRKSNKGGFVLDVAVKIVGMDSDGLKQAARDELMIMKRVSGKRNCIRFIEAYADSTSCYMVMEKCDTSLDVALHNPYFKEVCGLSDESVIARIMNEVFLSLQAIHSVRIAHRDVKPANILCSGHLFHIKLCDFGLAVALPEGGTILSRGGGTALFQSPEVAKRKMHGCSTDVWSAAVVGYLLLFEEFPYGDAAQSSQVVRARIGSGIPEPRFRRSMQSTLQQPGSPASASAEEALRCLLRRIASQRPSAQEVLGLPWFKEHQPDNTSGPPVQPVLPTQEAGSMVGACKTPIRVSNNRKQRSPSLDQKRFSDFSFSTSNAVVPFNP